jgi:TolA-binding protein
MLKALLQNVLGLMLGVTLLLTGCATTSSQSPSRAVERSPIDLREEQVTLLSDRVQRQDQLIEKLSQSLTDLRSELRKLREVSETSPKLPVEKLKAGLDDEDEVGTNSEIDGDEADETAKRDDESTEKGKIIADSSDEAMHWYYEGLRYQRRNLYEDSIKALDKFLKSAPEHVYADRAQYLVAYDYLRNKEYGLAIVQTNKLESKYPNSFKLPEALMARALAYQGLGQITEAKATLQDLLRRYPSEKVSDMAAKKLAELLAVDKDTKTDAPKLINELDF